VCKTYGEFKINFESELVRIVKVWDWISKMFKISKSVNLIEKSLRKEKANGNRKWWSIRVWFES
jgi:hypothetical protein